MSDSRHATFARLFAESRDALRRYVRRLVRSQDTADEIVQEAFLRTYVQGDAVQTPRAFLFSTARNLASDHRRHSRIAATDTLGDFDDSRVVSSCGPLEDQLIADEASKLLKEAVDRLPPQCHAAFVLKVFHGCSYKEISDRLGLSQKTVEKHIAGGLLKTHAYLRLRYPQMAPRTVSRHGTAPMKELDGTKVTISGECLETTHGREDHD